MLEAFLILEVLAGMRPRVWPMLWKSGIVRRELKELERGISFLELQERRTILE